MTPELKKNAAEGTKDAVRVAAGEAEPAQKLLQVVVVGFAHGGG